MLNQCYKVLWLVSVSLVSLGHRENRIFTETMLIYHGSKGAVSLQIIFIFNYLCIVDIYNNLDQFNHVKILESTTSLSNIIQSKRENPLFFPSEE